MSREDKRKNMGTPAERLPQVEQKHPERYAGDLNPHHMAGQNIGRSSADQETGLTTAYDHKDIHRGLRGFADDELKQIPILPEGTRLQQGAKYLDLDDRERNEFAALGDMIAEPGHHFVPKDRVPYPVWNRLMGDEKPIGRSDPDRPANLPER